MKLEKFHETETKLLKKLEEAEFINKLLAHGASKKARNAIAEIISDYIKSPPQVSGLMKAMASYLHGTEFTGMVQVFRVLNAVIAKADNPEIFKIISTILYGEIEFHFTYIASFYTISYHLGKLLKKYPAFAKEFNTAERSSKILQQMEVFKGGISPYIQKSYELLKIKRGTGEQTKVFCDQIKYFDSALKSPFTVKLVSPYKSPPEPDSEEELKCTKGSEYDIFDQGCWVKAKLELDEENFLFFGYKTDKEFKAQIFKDSDDYYLADKKTKNYLFKALYKLK